MQISAREIQAEEAFGLLKGWFNNKMSVVIFRIQYTHVYLKKGKTPDVREQIIFLNDIQHHFSRQGINKNAYHKATKWLKVFFQSYPEKITPERTQRAWQMLKAVYEGFGFAFPFNEPGVKHS